MTKRTHKDIVQSVKRLCAALGGKLWVTGQVGRVYGSPGIPDCRATFPFRYGLAFWFEAKTDGDKLSPEQEEFIRMEEACGGVVVVGDEPEFTAYLRGKGIEYSVTGSRADRPREFYMRRRRRREAKP